MNYFFNLSIFSRLNLQIILIIIAFLIFCRWFVTACFSVSYLNCNFEIRSFVPDFYVWRWFCSSPKWTGAISRVKRFLVSPVLNSQSLLCRHPSLFLVWTYELMVWGRYYDMTTVLYITIFGLVRPWYEEAPSNDIAQHCTFKLNVFSRLFSPPSLWLFSFISQSWIWWMSLSSASMRLFCSHSNRYLNMSAQTSSCVSNFDFSPTVLSSTIDSNFELVYFTT